MSPIASPIRYQNPRMDGPEGSRGLSAASDAEHGQVHIDPTKLIWVGGMLLLGTVGSAMTITAGAVVLFLLSTAITLLFGHSLGMHRRLIHRSYECPRWLEYLLVHFGVLVGLAGPLGMVRTHDLRDWAQRQSRCHAFFAHRQVWYRDVYWQLVCSIKLTSPPAIRVEPEIAGDPVYQFMERYWMWQQLPWALLFYFLGDWAWVCWGIGSRVTVGVLGHWLIGYFAHNQGGRDWHVEGAAVQGFNVSWCALITMGECWHNNHHAFPGSARLGLEPGQWDPGWWMLKGMMRIGLAANPILPEAISQRPELQRITAGESQQERPGMLAGTLIQLS